MSSLPPEPAGATPGPPPAAAAWQPTEILQRPAPGRGNALPPGAHLAEFELLRVLGEGGFGIVYLAHDHSLQRRVAIKEYMPASLAMRSGAQDVVVTADKHLPVFTAGLDSFINEARLLAQFDHASLLKVYRFWRANGTAYMVMPYYEGMTLKERLRQAGTPAACRHALETGLCTQAARHMQRSPDLVLPQLVVAWSTRARRLACSSKVTRPQLWQCAKRWF